jgi:predicted CXXCH cytochrome family protein
MKRLSVVLCAALFSAVLCISAEADIASSKHNLSASGKGTIKATAETELCVFCHVPHNANPAVPLWNHTVSTAAYTMYTSDYLTRAGYATPTDVGQRSRLCLSCHDGTVAIGSVYTLRGVAQTSPIGMSGVDAFGKMPGTAAAFLGVDLRDDHPVSIKYDTGISITFGSGTRGMELNATAPSINPKPYTGVKLYGTASGTIKGYVECTSCHDPHNDTNPDFLVVSNVNGALCVACHSKTGWSGSIHQASAVTVNNPAGETQPIPAGTIAQAACMACHKNHTGLGTPYLLRKVEENTCFSPANAGTSPTATSCHGANTTVAKNNLQTVLSRFLVHPTIATAGKHKNLDVLDYTLLGAGNRHAECVDCHNPHQATNFPHRVAAGGWYPSTAASTSNLVSNSGALKGVPGVTPGAAAMWTARTAYTVTAAATYEYEICYKCHSYYAIRNSTSPVASWSGLSSAYITDQAWEFNPANRSGHPVEVSLGSRSGSTEPKALAANQLLTGTPDRSAARGNQTMYCSDCHGADNENSTDPNGPHGSNSLFMLKGPNKTWPGTFTLNNRTMGQGTASGLFCLNCHPLTLSESVNRVHSEGDHRNALCVNCHTAVPHGSRLSRLIAYSAPIPLWGAPYGNQSLVIGFKKAAPPPGGGAPEYSKTNCQTIGSGCGDDHKSTVIGAEN